MFELPTDRLCKFLAVGGLLVAIVSGVVGAERYHQAEMRRIDAAEKAEAAKVAYARLSEAVERQVELSRSIRAQRDAAQRSALLGDFWKLNDETDRLKTATDAAIIELRKHGDLNRHFTYMRTLWAYAGSLIAALGIVASAVGFLRWNRHEKDGDRKAG